MPTEVNTELNIIEPTRVKNFANFFKNYMSIWSVVVAALPIPITSFDLIPTFAYQKTFLSTYTTLFCFLILGYIFYSRHKLAKFFFPDYYKEKYKIQLFAQSKYDLVDEARRYVYSEKGYDVNKSIIESKLEIYNAHIGGLYRKSIMFNSLPFILIIASLTSAYLYNTFMENLMAKMDTAKLTRDEILKLAYPPSGSSNYLIITYLCIFLFAEAAFILMAIKEYIQDLLRINDESLMIRSFDSKSRAEPISDKVTVDAS